MKISSSQMLNESQINQFHRDGFIVLKQMCPSDLSQSIKELALAQLEKRISPFELEADLKYPGAPIDERSPGSNTIRRLTQAYGRGEAIDMWATSHELHTCLKQLMGKDEIYLVRSHHNCVMTKQPLFSSDSCWHQDLRYWRYTNGGLISSWLALGKENSENGGLQVIPGSHKLSFEPQQFDEQLFFKKEHERNHALIQQKISVDLEQGDCLLFHCRLLHSASRNFSEQLKLAVVFTYRNKEDTPVEGTRSSSLEDVSLLSSSSVNLSNDSNVEPHCQ